MKNKRQWACFQGILLCFGMFAAMSASAQSQLPSSVSPAISGPWKMMRAGSFEPTPASARMQCERAARQSQTDTLTTSQCVQFESMLAKGQCESVQVSDGVIHDFMSYLRGGKNSISQGVPKAHGHNTSALLCSLSNNVHGYFYTGSRKHCNNAAFVLLSPAPILPPVVEVVETEPVKKCRFVKREVIQVSNTFVSVPDSYTCGIYIPGVTAMVPGGIQSSSSMVCD